MRRSLLLNWLPFTLCGIIIFSTIGYIPNIWIKWYDSYGTKAVTHGVQAFIAGLLLLLFIYLVYKTQEGKKQRVIIYGLIVLIAYAIPLYSMKNPSERMHFVEYGLWYLFAVQGFEGRTIPAFILITIMSIIDEGIQSFLPNRYGQIGDVLMNMLAAGLAWQWLRIYRFGIL